MAKKSRTREASFEEYREAISRAKGKQERKAVYKLYKTNKEKSATRAARELLYPESKVLRGTRSTGRFIGRKLAGLGKGSAKQTSFKQRKVKNLAAAFGLAGGARPGAGRPKGSGKYQRAYGIGVNQYRKLLSSRRALARGYADKKREDLIRKGYRPEEIEQIIRTQPIQQPESPTVHVDDDLAYRKFLAQNTITPNTQRILERLRHTQLKSVRDDVDMQRRIRERKIVSDAGNLLKTPFIFKNNLLDFTGVPADNILLAPNTFKNNPEHNILRPRQITVLTPIQGNNIMEKRPDSISLISQSPEIEMSLDENRRRGKLKWF